MAAILSGALIRLITNQSFANLCLFLLIVTVMEANKDFLTLFLICDKIKQNVNNNKILQYYGVRVIL